MNKNPRTLLIQFITFIGGLYFFLEFVLPKEINGFELGKYHDSISKGVVLVGAMAIGLGIINLLRVHGKNILLSRKGQLNSYALIIGMFAIFAIEIKDFLHAEERTREVQEIAQLVSFIDLIKNGENQQLSLERTKSLSNFLLNKNNNLKNHTHSTDSFLYKPAIDNTENSNAYHAYQQAMQDAVNIKIYEAEKVNIENLGLLSEKIKLIASSARELSSINYTATKTQKTSHFFFTGLFVPLGSAMFSLLAFYVTVAAYRTFRLHSLEATLMMTAAIVVMLGQIPHGPAYIYSELPAIRLWLLKYISTPAFRAIFFGSAIAGLAMAVRMWLSLERSPLAVEDE